MIVAAGFVYGCLCLSLGVGAHWSQVRPDNPQEELEVKVALHDYLNRRHPDDKEKLEMLSLHFSMFREIGENLYRAAMAQIDRFGRKPPGRARFGDLVFIVQQLSEAAANFQREECLARARTSIRLARLVGLQAQMTDVALLNMDAGEVGEFLQQHPNFREALIVAEAYQTTVAPAVEWAMPM